LGLIPRWVGNVAKSRVFAIDGLTFPRPDLIRRGPKWGDFRIKTDPLSQLSLKIMLTQTLPIPDHFDPAKVGNIWPVPYQQRATAAAAWARQFNLPAASTDPRRVCLLAIDVQNTFCLPNFELFVGGRSGTGAVDDTRRLCEFIYRNLGHITTIIPTLDTHTALQIFHPAFWVNAAGEHPTPIATMITLGDVEQGHWRVNPAITASLQTGSSLYGAGSGDYAALQAHALHYTLQLTQAGKYPLTIWSYHSMLGGIGHALVPAFEEAAFFHCIARSSQTQFELKGAHPLTENYSVLRPEVMTQADGQPLAPKNSRLIQTLLDFDIVVIAGQAKSHCVAWTIDDLLSEIQAKDPALARKVYLLEDCTSPVVVPGVVDFTEAADAAYARFAVAGMQVVRSGDLIADW
jgi:nicotinamidase-related amidase